jgi:DNA-binding CsgD family transcriptional regulator
VQRGVITLDLSTDGVPELLADFEVLVLWELMRRSRPGAGIAEVAAGAGVPTKSAQALVDRLVALGLVEARATGRRRAIAYHARPGPLVVTFDPEDPKTAFRLAAARLALMGHLRRLGSVRPSRAARKGSAWRRESVAVLPLEGQALEIVKACLDRVDACLEAATEAAGRAGTGQPDTRPRYRVHVAVDPVESRSLSLPVVLLMERGEAASRAVRTPTIGTLSSRERQVAAALAKGQTKREVAQSLGLAFATVNTLAVRAYRKLGIRRRAQLADALQGAR